MDLTTATGLPREVSDAVEDAFGYHKWTPEQVEIGAGIRKILVQAVKIIIAEVPPGPDRTVAIRKIREAQMDVDSAIIHGGKY